MAANVGAAALAAAGTTGDQVSVALNFQTADIESAYARTVDPIALTLDLGNFDLPSGLTQYDAPYQTSLLNQDGNGPTDLERVFFSDTGLLTAVFADGSSRPIYRYLLLQFQHLPNYKVSQVMRTQLPQIPARPF